MESSESGLEHEHERRFKGTSDNFRDDGHRSHNQTRGKGSVHMTRGGTSFPHYRLVILCLGLLDTILLLAAIVIGVYCIKESKGDIPIPEHLADTPIIIEFNYLRSNHSQGIKDQEEAQKALDREIVSHGQLKLLVDQQKTVNDGLQLQIESLQATKTQLQSENSAFEGNCGRCLPGWVFLNTSCYFFTNVDTTPKRDWPDSRADCLSRGADLLVIDSWEEQQLLNANVPASSASETEIWWANGFWIGLTDIEREGTWVWVNNVTAQPLYWMIGEPNNHGEQGENCAAIHYKPDSRMTWYDGKCNHHQYKWICEMAPL